MNLHVWELREKLAGLDDYDRVTIESRSGATMNAEYARRGTDSGMRVLVICADGLVVSGVLVRAVRRCVACGSPSGAVGSGSSTASW